ncbi:protein kinase, partial [Lotmaria passim]
MNNTGPLSPVNGVGKSGTTTSCGESKKLRSLFSDDDDDDDEDRVMTTNDEAVFALIRSPLTDNESEWSTPLIGSRRPRVPHDSIDDADDNNFVAEDGQRRPDDSSVDRALTDMVPGTLPAIQKRAKDEVDVAAAGIPLEVRRFQCTKSTLALKEATKNDATPQSPKLVDYLVSMTKSSDGLCTEKEMCRWLVAQMCDRLQTGQLWVMAKTSALLSALLWRGSISFVAAVHDYGKTMFDAAYIEKLIRETEQANVSGDRLPCLLQPIASASAGQKSACGKVKSHSSCVFEMMKRKTSGDSCRAKRGADGRVGTEDVPEGDLNFLITNVAYLESLCEYRMRHPTLDLVHGEILMADISDAAAQADPAVAATLRKTYSPTAWKELLDDTLELMKAIASTDPQVPICSLGRVAANTRLRESVLLYQVACRALVRLLHSVLTVSHTFIASMQAGLNICSNLAPADGSAKPPSPTETSTASNFLGVSFDPNALDYSLTPDVVHGFTHDYYYAIYQFNRTVNMLRAYCEAAEHVDKDTSKRALAAFKVLPEACILELKSSFHHIDHPLCSNTIGRLFSAARHAAQTRKASSGDSTSCGSDHSPTSPVLSPLSDEEVRQSMLAVYTFHLQHKSLQDQMWRDQVNAVCGLFDEKESNVLHQIFTA